MSTNWAKINPKKADAETVKQAKSRAKERVQKEAEKAREVEVSHHEPSIVEAAEPEEIEPKPKPFYFPLERLKYPNLPATEIRVFPALHRRKVTGRLG